MSRVSPETMSTIVHVWRACMAAAVIAVATMIWSNNERTTRTADKVQVVEKSVEDGARDLKQQIATLAATLEILKASVTKTESAINLSVLRILEEHTRQIGELQSRDTRTMDEVSALRVQLARLEAELTMFRRAMDTPPAGRVGGPR